jgi:hypothetical protein
MNTPIGLERCLTFINCQLQPGASQPHGHGASERRAITISRQAGSGAHAVGEALSRILTARNPSARCPWTLFDRNLVEKVLEDHHLPSQLARFMPEDRTPQIADVLDDLFGLHPPSELLVRRTADTILRLAEMGSVILIGRAATVVTARLDYVFHVRLVGSLEKRAAHMMELNPQSKAEAIKFIQQEDLGRARYLKKYFAKDIDDPLLYHMVINTDMVSYEEAAELIAQAMPQHSEEAVRTQPQTSNHATATARSAVEW